MELQFERFWNNLGFAGQRELAVKTGMSRQYLYMIANGYRKAGIEACAKLTRDPRITHHMLRPDLYDPPKRSAK